MSKEKVENFFRKRKRVTTNKLGKEFFFGPKGQEALIFLFFLFVAFGFWILQALNETFETEIEVPLQLENVPENVMITTAPPSHVHVTVRDRGAVLVKYFRKQKLKTVNLLFDKYDNGSDGSRVRIPHSDVTSMIQGQLNGTTNVLSLEPDTLEFYFNRGLARKLPVKHLGKVSTTSQNYLRTMTSTPDSVTVYAPAKVLDTMRMAYTDEFCLEELRNNTTMVVSMLPIKGVRYIPENVEITADVDYYTEKTVEVPIVGVNFPADRTLRTFPAKAKITFRIGAAEYEKINAENFVLTATYEELLRNSSSKFPLQLKSTPKGISNIRINPQEVDYLIEQSIVESNEEQD